MAYDQNNIFAKILRGEIPCKKVYEDGHVLAFEDIAPKRPVHVLVIPKGPYEDATTFAAEASDVEQAALWKAVGLIVKQTGVDKTGYRIISNTGEHGHQEVPHLHLHILGGASCGPMVKAG
ncbi:MAG: histidine triad nucleotide-binding protein [Caenispirillum sp.]|nr:histidine triad nucleotide-binding protein [Caenispirillum sp.]